MVFFCSEEEVTLVLLSAFVHSRSSCDCDAQAQAFKAAFSFSHFRMQNNKVCTTKHCRDALQVNGNG